MLKNNDLKPRLAPRYIIKAGGLKKSAGKDTTYPEKWDHFKVCSPTEKDEVGNPVPANEWMQEHLGTTMPKELPFIVFSDNMAQFYDDGYAARTKNNRFCYSLDGETAHWSRKVMKLTQVVDNPMPEPMVSSISEDDPQSPNICLNCLGPDCYMQNTKPQAKCKLNMRLTGFIKTEKDNVFSGCDVFFSSSRTTASQMRGSIALILSITGGHPSFLPMILRLSPKRVNVEGKPITVFVASLHPQTAIEDIPAQVAQIQGNLNRLALPATTFTPAVDIVEEDEEVLEQEFYPEGESGPRFAAPLSVKEALLEGKGLPPTPTPTDDTPPKKEGDYQGSQPQDGLFPPGHGVTCSCKDCQAEIAKIDKATKK